MALTLDATIGGANSNTYILLADAEIVMEGVFYKDNWVAATEPNKNIALVQATRMLDELMNWFGTRSDSDSQALEFPRYGCPKRPGYDGYTNFFDDDEIPTWLENATVIMADAILGSNRGADSDTKGFKRMKVDVLELEIDSTDRQDTMPDNVYEIVKFYGDKAGTNMYVIRT
ncbi:MAG: hypothetical protein GY861_19065 [bacterium]|nr:hypothetical protein [bacterium]